MKKSTLLRFGKNVRSLREAKGLSQEQLGDICNLHRTYIGGIERGERNVSLVNIVILAKNLGVKITDLFEGIS